MTVPSDRKEAARAAARKLRSSRAGIGDKYADLFDDLAAVVERYENALRKYGAHGGSCQKTSGLACSCGFDEALAGTEESA